MLGAHVASAHRARAELAGYGATDLVLLFWGQVGMVAKENPRAILSHRILLVVLCGLAFLRLVFTDYGYL